VAETIETESGEPAEAVPPDGGVERWEGPAEPRRTGGNCRAGGVLFLMAAEDGDDVGDCLEELCDPHTAPLLAAALGAEAVVAGTLAPTPAGTGLSEVGLLVLAEATSW